MLVNTETSIVHPLFIVHRSSFILHRSLSFPSLVGFLLRSAFVGHGAFVLERRSFSGKS
jgi:hypothetical protein